MDEIIIFSKGKIYITKEKMNSDEFILLCAKEFLNCPLLSLTVVREGGEKPRLSQPLAEFSLTHTDGYLAVALSFQAVGLDAERLDRVCDYAAVSQRFFVRVSQTPLDFFRQWTAAEATAKLFGTPLISEMKRALTPEYFVFETCLFAVVTQ